MASKKSEPKTDGKAQQKAGSKTRRIPVRATRLGYYGDQRRKPGDEFRLASEEELMSWMERLDGGVNPKAPKPADEEADEDVEADEGDEGDEA